MVVAFRNDDAPGGYKLIGVECAFLDSGRAVAQSGIVIENLAYGETAYTEVGRKLMGAKFDSASCHVSYAYAN